MQPSARRGIKRLRTIPTDLFPVRIIRIKTQQGVSLGSVLDFLCLTDDCSHALGGIPKGCTIALAGPPGKGKTRTALAGLTRVAADGNPVAFVVAEEGFHNDVEAGRDDLCSRLTKIGMASTGMDESQLAEKVLSNIYVLQSQYHRGQTWDDFVTKYRYLVEKEKIRFVVIDSLNMLDPTKNRTADNLSALKTYNHEKGITCICIGQIRDTGMPVGGEALMHTAVGLFDRGDELGLEGDRGVLGRQIPGQNRRDQRGEIGDDAGAAVSGARGSGAGDGRAGGERIAAAGLSAAVGEVTKGPTW